MGKRGASGTCPLQSHELIAVVSVLAIEVTTMYISISSILHVINACIMRVYS